jgi:hypothetical protein
MCNKKALLALLTLYIRKPFIAIFLQSIIIIYIDMENFLIVLVFILKQPNTWVGLAVLFIYIIYKIRTWGVKNTAYALTDQKTFVLLFAYFLKLTGVAVAIFFIFGLFMVYSDTTSSIPELTREELWPFVLIIMISVFMFVVGGIWSEKLLKDIY